jgi:hypothetical protein
MFLPNLGFPARDCGDRARIGPAFPSQSAQQSPRAIQSSPRIPASVARLRSIVVAVHARRRFPRQQLRGLFCLSAHATFPPIFVIARRFYGLPFTASSITRTIKLGPGNFREKDRTSPISCRVRVAWSCRASFEIVGNQGKWLQHDAT